MFSVVLIFVSGCLCNLFSAIYSFFFDVTLIFAPCSLFYAFAFGMDYVRDNEAKKYMKRWR